MGLWELLLGSFQKNKVSIRIDINATGHVEKKPVAKLEYDSEADCLYIRVGSPSSNSSLASVRASDQVIIDYDFKNGQLIGVELIGVKDIINDESCKRK
jgi:uncharacterized protein YuzE